MEKTRSENRTQIYYKRDRVYETCKKRFKKWNGSVKNKELISSFHRFLFAKGTGGQRVTKLTTELIWVCNNLNKDLDSLTYKDLEEIVAKIYMNNKWKDRTKEDYIIVLKQFYNWYEDEDPRLMSSDPIVQNSVRRLYKYLKKHVKRPQRLVNIQYSEIISDADCQQLIQKGAKNALERAIISILHSTGVRVGELLGIRIKDIEIKSKYGMLRVFGKTGERRIPILESIPYLVKWIEEHPEGDNPNALLWVSKHNKYYAEPLRYIGICRLLERVGETSGFKKKYNPHWFRHSRATLWAPNYSEAILCKLMGWTLGSKQTKTYVHIGAGQVESAFLINNGLSKKESETEQKIINCVCGTINNSNSKYCYKCGKPLSVKTVIEDEQKKNDAISEAFDLFSKIMLDANLRKQFEEFKEKQGGK